MIQYKLTAIVQKIQAESSLVGSKHDTVSVDWNSVQITPGDTIGTYTIGNQEITLFSRQNESLNFDNMSDDDLRVISKILDQCQREFYKTIIQKRMTKKRDTVTFPEKWGSDKQLSNVFSHKNKPFKILLAAFLDKVLNPEFTITPKLGNSVTTTKIEVNQPSDPKQKSTAVQKMFNDRITACHIIQPRLKQFIKECGYLTFKSTHPPKVAAEKPSANDGSDGNGTAPDVRLEEKI